MYLRRTPLYLRVTRGRLTFITNALDQLGDRPGEKDELFVYQRESEGEPAQRGNEMFPTALYRLVILQPSQSIMQAEASWQNWCRNKAAGEGR